MLRFRWELKAQRDGHRKVYAALEKVIRSGSVPIPKARVRLARLRQESHSCLETGDTITIRDAIV